MHDQTNSQAVVLVPIEKKTFTISEIPALLAVAKWPHADGYWVSYPLRVNAPLTRGEMLTPDDESTLHAIWNEAKLPKPEFPMALDDWQRYVAAFNESKQKPKWELWQCVQCDALDNTMFREAAREVFEKNLRDAISRGEIRARDPLSGMPVSANDSRALFNPENLLLSREDFESFARMAMIEVRNEQDCGHGETMPLWKERALYYRERVQQGSDSPTKDTKEHFDVSDTTVKTDVRRLNREEGTDSGQNLKPKTGRKGGRK